MLNLFAAPIIGGGDKFLGILVADLKDAIDQENKQLFTIYSKQLSAAISNTLLHGLIAEKNTALQDAYQRLRDGYLETIEMLRLVVDAKDTYTRGHSDRVSSFSQKLASYLGKDHDFVERVRVAGLFHDIGKLATSDAVLTKNGKLSDDEFEHIQKHSTLSATILSSVSTFTELSAIAKAHHERYDGHGYPDHLSGDLIPIEARIITIADAYDAMTSDRHYRRSLTMEHAVEQLRMGRGSQFDATLVDAFLSMLESDAICGTQDYKEDQVDE